MKPIQLTISAWGPFAGEESIDFTTLYNNDMFLITGATGSGKTTIFDALTYAIYGMVSGRTRDKASVRSDFAKDETDTFVELKFSHYGKYFHVKRSPKYSRKKKRGEGYIVSSETAEFCEEGKSPVTILRDVNQTLQEVMGLSYEQYKQITMIAQGEFMDLLLAGSKERVEIFRNLFKTGKFERIQRNLTERAKHLYRDITEVRHKMEEVLSMIDTADEEELSLLLNAEYPDYKKIVQILEESVMRDKKASGELMKRMEEMEQFIQRLMAKGQAYFDLQQRLEFLEKEVNLHAEKKEKAEIAYKKALEDKELQKNNLQTQLSILKDTLGKDESELKSSKKDYLKYDFLDRKEGELLLIMERLRSEKEGLLRLKKKEEAIDFAQNNLSKEQKAYENAVENAKKTKVIYEEIEDAYRAAAIGLVARLVEKGKPCPVCGSLEHPVIASLSADVPDEKEVKKWKQNVEKQEKLVGNQYKIAANEKGILDALQDEFIDSCKLLDVEKNELNQAIDNKNREELLKKTEWEALIQEKKKKKCLFDKITCLESSIEKHRKEQEKQRGYADKELEKLQEKEVKFRTEAEKEKALLKGKEAEYNKLQKQEESYKENIEVEAMKNQLKEAQTSKKAFQKQKESLFARQKINQAALVSLKEKMVIRDEKEEVYGVYQDLDNVAKGNNKDRIVFEQYVLAAYFEDVLMAANLRFMDMTAGRYELMRVLKVTDARTTDNLELEVFDNFTGKRRSVKTLSGGESFKAALSMALGLSDIVQNNTGGVCVETLFIDEGFGSLDEESLDQALTSLINLSGHQQMIGIISHVNELKERIEQKIVVEKGNYGSFISK